MNRDMGQRIASLIGAIIANELRLMLFPTGKSKAARKRRAKLRDANKPPTKPKSPYQGKTPITPTYRVTNEA